MPHSPTPVVPRKPTTFIINSPAIDAAPTSGGSCVNNTDQRGFSRPNDGNADGVFDCDIGSVEAPTITIIEPRLPLPPPPKDQHGVVAIRDPRAAVWFGPGGDRRGGSSQMVRHRQEITFTTLCATCEVAY
jgi:hypothetical protein